MRRDRRTDGPSLRGPVACCLLAVVALSLGPSGDAAVRSAVRDAARPGFLIQRWLTARFESLDASRWPWTAEQPALPLASAVATDPADRELRRLRAALASARRELAVFDRSLGPVRAMPQDTADSIERLPARVLHAGNDDMAAGGVMLASGTIDGAESGRIAVEPILLAAGDETDVAAGATVLAGAAVVGRTADVGLWTSTLLPVTHPDFRAHVWIVRESSDGPAFGEEGVLEGDGHGGCVVKYVPSTAVVSVGDHVYSRDPTGRIPQPLYYGRIVRADLADGAPHWNIRLRPAADPTAVEQVHVLAPREREAPAEPTGGRSSR